MFHKYNIRIVINVLKLNVLLPSSEHLDDRCAASIAHWYNITHNTVSYLRGPTGCINHHHHKRVVFNIALIYLFLINIILHR